MPRAKVVFGEDGHSARDHDALRSAVRDPERLQGPVHQIQQPRTFQFSRVSKSCDWTVPTGGTRWIPNHRGSDLSQNLRDNRLHSRQVFLPMIQPSISIADQSSFLLREINERCKKAQGHRSHPHRRDEGGGP
jgi:hypothetical protein